MKTKLLFLVLSTLFLNSCNWMQPKKVVKEVSTSDVISKMISSRMISDAKEYAHITWSYHPYIKKCFYNEEKEIYLYKRDSLIMLVDYKNNVVHNFNKYESQLIIVSIEEFEKIMHDIDLGKIKINIANNN